MARFVPFSYMFRDLIPRAVDLRAPLPFLGCCRWWWWGCCSCCWWGWFYWWWLQRQRRGGPFFLWTRTDMRGGGMDLWGGVVGGGRMVLGCLGDEGVEWEGPGRGDDFRPRSSRFLNSRSCSNFSRPGLKDLTLGGCALFRWGLGWDFVFWRGWFLGIMWGGGLLDFLEGGKLSVPTWADFWERGSSGWSFLPPFPTVSHSAFASSELTAGDEGGSGVFFYPLVWARLREPPFLCLF